MTSRIIFDESAPLIVDLYKTTLEIFDLHSEKVRIHPSDSIRVLHALKIFKRYVNQLNILSKL